MAHDVHFYSIFVYFLDLQCNEDLNFTTGFK